MQVETLANEKPHFAARVERKRKQNCSSMLSCSLFNLKPLAGAQNIVYVSIFVCT
jgi:hypothetical protein